MKRFYKSFVVLGIVATLWLFAQLVILRAPWWTYLATAAALLLIEFGCFAWKDLERRKAVEAKHHQLLAAIAKAGPMQRSDE